MVDMVGEPGKPVGDDGPACLEMELGAVGRAADAEGLMPGGGAGGKQSGALRKGEGVGMPLEDRKALRCPRQDRIGAAGLGSLSRLSIRALTATMKLDPDIDSAAISGRRTRPNEGSKIPAAMGSAMTL